MQHQAELPWAKETAWLSQENKAVTSEAAWNIRFWESFQIFKFIKKAKAFFWPFRQVNPT